ncbi:MAG: hypothetical protein AAF490_20565 [Chloroflexota bacterium]
MLTLTQTFLSTAFIIGIGTFVLITCGAFIGYSVGNQKPQPPEAQKRLPWALFLLVGVWFGVAIATSTAGLISLQLVLPFFSFPVVIGWLLSYSEPVKKLIKGIPTHWLILVQSYRMAGGIFIFPYLTAGVLTRGFAINAGIGDVLTGVFALGVGWAVFKYGARMRWLFYSWTAFGILDLVLAMMSAGVFGFAAKGVAPNFPITAIPLFYGPPFGILIHIITLRNFNLRYSEDAQEKTAVNHQPSNAVS